MLPLAWTLGWLDIKLRYRGSVIGPFWLTLSTAVMVGALGFLYSTLFKQEIKTYLPFLALSLVLWNYLNAVVTEACTCFTQGEGMIRSVRLPFVLHALRCVFRNLLSLAHNIVVIAGVYLWVYLQYGLVISADVLTALPVLLLWIVDSLAACLVLGALCARFRDIPPIVGSIMQIAFFVSAIMWRPNMFGPVQPIWLRLNPFFSLVEVARAPLLGEPMPGHLVYFSAIGWSLFLCLGSWAFFARARSRLAFWV